MLGERSAEPGETNRRLTRGVGGWPLTFTLGEPAHWSHWTEVPVAKESVMEPMSISELARRSRLSHKALRLYDEMGLLPQARVDAVNGYRFYETDQIASARLIAELRQLGIPLAEIKVVLELEPELAADRIAEYWSGV